MDFFTSIFIGIVVAATPLIFAAIGEVVVEKSGVLNLGIEGMMIIGALAGFAVTHETQSFTLGIVAAAAGGALMALLFAVITQTLMANQVATGLALTMLGLGLSALLGQGFSGQSVASLPKLDIPLLSDLPVIGRMFFRFDILVYGSFALVAATAWFLSRTRAGMIVRAVGENHDAAHSIGYSVVAWRYMTLLFGGACAGLGGAYLSLAQTPLWVENMSAGRGWIALALVVFGAWQPVRAMMGAFLFGGITILQLHSQGFAIAIDPQILSMLPYLATIAVLVVFSRNKGKLKPPGNLGTPFYAAT